MFSIVTFADSRISTSSGNSSSSLRSSCCRSGDGDRSLGSPLLRTCRSFCLLDNHLSPLHSTQGQNGIFGRPYAVRAVSTRVFQDSSVRTASFIRSMPHLRACTDTYVKAVNSSVHTLDYGWTICVVRVDAASNLVHEISCPHA